MGWVWIFSGTRLWPIIFQLIHVVVYANMGSWIGAGTRQKEGRKGFVKGTGSGKSGERKWDFQGSRKLEN